MAEPRAMADPVRRKLAWVILFRLVLDTVLLGGTAVWQVRARRGTPPLAVALYRIVLATFVASLGLRRLARDRARAPAGSPGAQIAARRAASPPRWWPSPAGPTASSSSCTRSPSWRAPSCSSGSGAAGALACRRRLRPARHAGAGARPLV